MRKAMKLDTAALMLALIGMPGSRLHAQSTQQPKPPFEHALPNVPGKSLVAVVVNYAPGGKTPPHHHASSAFIYARVLSGSIRSQVDDGPAKVYQVGDEFYEEPGAHHRISENASPTEPASLLAVFIVDTKDKPLTTLDQKPGPR